MKGEEFDRDIAIQLIERIEGEEEGTATLEEFIEVLIEADMVLEQKIEEISQEIPKMEEQVANESNDSKPPSGILEEQPLGTTLTIHVIEASNLDSLSDELFQLQVKISVQNDEKLQTTLVTGSPNPVWQEEFKMYSNSISICSLVSLPS